MKKIKYVLLITILSLVGLSAYAEKAEKNGDGTDVTSFRYSYFEASKEKVLGNLLKAEELFQNCVAINKNEPAPHYELASIYFLNNNYSKALHHSILAYKLDPENIWYRLFLADIYLKTKHYKESAAVFKKLVEDYPNYIDYYFDWATVYLNANKLKNALEVYDKLEEIMGVNEELSIQKERIYLKMDKMDKAVEEIRKLIKSDPSKPEYYELLSELYRANNMPDKAMEVMDELLVIDPDNAFVHLFLYDFHRTKGDNEKAISELKMAFKIAQIDLETKVGIMIYYYQTTEKDTSLLEEAYSLLDLLIEAHPKESKAFSLYADFLNRDERLEDAREKYRLAVELEPALHLIWRQVLIINSALRDSVALIEESEAAIELFPSIPIFYLFNGLGQLEYKRYEEAINILTTGRDMVTDQMNTLLHISSSLGDAYNETRNFEESDKAFDKVLELDSNNIHVLNNYSYYLSLREDKLEKAKTMSKKSNDMDSANASYLDTYGWILYKMKDYDGAIIWLKKAMESGGSKNAIIVEHLADAQFRKGNKELAIENWIKAKSLGEGSELLDEKILKKDLVE
ncbi:MAG: tetratricopeptide repeat protein [Flavobacteriales bacterium]|nr:tetratricopeptide repeat protein [Flavobacteriales bacterium]